MGIIGVTGAMTEAVPVHHPPKYQGTTFNQHPSFWGSDAGAAPLRPNDLNGIYCNFSLTHKLLTKISGRTAGIIAEKLIKESLGWGGSRSKQEERLPL